MDNKIKIYNILKYIKVTSLNIGIFAPGLNICGGTEFIVVKMIEALRSEEFKITVLTNEKIDNVRIKKMFNTDIIINKNIVFPFNSQIFGQYADALRSLIIKINLDILIDPWTNILLPWTDVSYIHFPSFVYENYNQFPRFYKLYLSPYILYVKYLSKKPTETKTILANSFFTANKMTELTGIRPNILYPPVNTAFFRPRHISSRHNIVVTISRIASNKNLEVIPKLASIVGRNVFFYILGILHEPKALASLQKEIRRKNVESKVRILTDVSRNDMRKILWKSKVFLSTQGINPKEVVSGFGIAIRQEIHGFGIAIVEAMSAGCIPIVHDSGGPREFVPKKLRYTTIEEAKKILQEVLQNWNTSQCKKMIEISSKFNENIFAEKFLHIIGRL